MDGFVVPAGLTAEALRTALLGSLLPWLAAILGVSVLAVCVLVLRRLFVRRVTGAMSDRQYEAREVRSRRREGWKNGEIRNRTRWV